MQAHIDRLEQVDGMLKELDRLLAAKRDPLHQGHMAPSYQKLRDARQVLRLTIDDLSLEDGNGDAMAGPRRKTDDIPRTNEEIAGLTDKDRLALHEVKLRAHGHTLTNTLGTIDILAARINQLVVQANSPGLAESVATGVKHDAELIRKAEREAKIDELRNLLDSLCNDCGYSPHSTAYHLLAGRIRELQAEGGSK